MKKNKKRNKGFTLVEILVAVFVFSLTIMTFVAIFDKGISGTDNAKRKMTAAYLGQEGIEYFRSMRDTFMLYNEDKQAGWNNFVNRLNERGCMEDTGCYFNNSNLYDLASITEMELSKCEGDCPRLLYDHHTGFGYSSGNASDFIRKMSAREVIPGEIKIVSEVFWRQGITSGSISFSENLTGWIE